uniref:LCCL domain-containing protein n=1 Tax=Branchiostoma floridae TaxID=7739 RepID=C3XV70_BRAFL|eukprot:XP_002611987.1 hypothetical protein BRAFLDRAFT_91873 [Branchiostoma floridae]
MMFPTKVTLILIIITVGFPPLSVQSDRPTDARPDGASPGAMRYVFPAWLPGVTVTPAEDVQFLMESLARATNFRKNLVTDFEVADCYTKGDDMPEYTTNVYCPAGCAAHRKASVWGAGTYNGASSLCRAAVHSGNLPNAAGGLVTMEKRPLAMLYPGSTKNGVKSSLLVINSKRIPKGDVKSFVVSRYRYEFGK